jgi:hypothetical protein
MAKKNANNDTGEKKPAEENRPATVYVEAQRAVVVRGAGTKQAGDRFECSPDQFKALGNALREVERVNTREGEPVQTR